MCITTSVYMLFVHMYNSVPWIVVVKFSNFVILEFRLKSAYVNFGGGENCNFLCSSKSFEVCSEELAFCSASVPYIETRGAHCSFLFSVQLQIYSYLLKNK